MQFFLAGGFPMIFVLVFGAVAALAALRHALAPREGGARPVLAYCGAVAAVSVAGVAVDLVEVTQALASDRFARDELPLVAAVGFGESLSPLILGFSLVAVALLGVAVGERRRIG